MRGLIISLLMLLAGFWTGEFGRSDVQMAFPFAALIPAAISAIGAIGGGRGRGRQNRANEQAIRFLQQLSTGALERGSAAFNSGLSALNSIIDAAGFSPELQQGLNDLTGFLNDLPSAPGQVVRLPEGLGDTSQLGNAAQAIEDFGFRGLGTADPDVGFLEDRALEFLQRAEGDPRLNAISQLSTDILSAGGRTPQTEQARRGFQDLFDEGGQTPETRQLSREGQRLLDQGGLTPELRELQGQFQQQLQTGGLTPEARQLFQALIPLVESGGEGGALIPREQAISFARDEAAQLARGTAESRQRQAFRRGAAPGTVSASGLQEQALVEADDQILQAQAQGIRDASLRQQTLQLQQFLGAAGASADVTRQAASVLASANTGLGDIARATSQNISTGGGLLSSAGQIGAANIGTAQQGLQGIFNNEVARLGVGSNLFLGIEGVRQDLRRLGVDTQLGAIGANQAGNAQALAALGVPIQAGLDLRAQNIGQRGQDVAQRGQDIGFLGQMTEVELRGLLGQLGLQDNAINRVLEAGRISGSLGGGLIQTGVQGGAAAAGASGNFAQNPLFNSLLTGGIGGLLEFADQTLAGGGGGAVGGTSGGFDASLGT